MVQVVKNNKGNFLRDEKAFLAKQTLKQMRERSEEEHAAARAKQAGLPYVDLHIIPLNTDFVFLVPEEEAKRLRAGIFFRRARTVHAALEDPKNSEAKSVVEAIASKNGWNVAWHLASASSIDRLLKKYERLNVFDSMEYMKLHVPDEDFGVFRERFAEMFAQKKTTLDMPVTQVLSHIMFGAIALGASDIHLEPKSGGGVHMRYRLDGVLEDVGDLPQETYKYLVSRIKMLADMKLNIRRSAQDGKFSFTVPGEKGEGERDVDIRVSILPEQSGETIVMRILDPKRAFLEIEELGMEGAVYERFGEELKKTNGMILTTGPTGSGKTTLLYAAISKLNKPGVNIVTIEDPVEYEMEGVSQTNVSKENNYTFATGLRSIVRQDPDIILVGEIRDEDTADIAVQAALTGHLVFTTLHTNSAAGSIPRLINLGVKPSLIPSAVNVFVAQRLVRRLCEHCKEAYVPAKETAQSIESILSIISPKSGVEIPSSVETLYRSRGCPKCRHTGYKGRIGIFEALFMTETMASLAENLASEERIAEAAMEEGMVTMTQDGVLKAVSGVTSLEEVWRVGGQFRFLREVYENLMERQLAKGVSVSQEVSAKVANLSLGSFANMLESANAQEILELVLAYALSLGAEDIHIEPEEERVRVRFRVDGVLQTAAAIDEAHYPIVLGSIKQLSGLNTQSQAGLRDSRFSLERELSSGETESVDVRASLLLGGYGETAVLRLLNIGAQARELSSLGMREDVRTALEEAMRTPNGIILATGPTGSGKSTTLYSVLSKLNEPHRKIMTVEDPIEYRMPGVLQTQVDGEKDYTFSSALRSLLRQNPDVILVGEIRDEETAGVAVRSSLTGHLVFSTLHTNDAPSAISRLANLGIAQRDIASSVSFVLAQRLVRRLCDCKRKRETTEEERRELRAFYAPYAKAANREMPEFSRVFEPVGCEKCRGIGYDGMMMVSEGMSVRESVVREAVLAGASAEEIRRIAIEQGMIPMVVDGIEKILAGETSIEEVRRVTEM